MAVFSQKLITYIASLLKPAVDSALMNVFEIDPVWQLTDISLNAIEPQSSPLSFSCAQNFNRRVRTAAAEAFQERGLVGVLDAYFDAGVSQDIAVDVERKVIALKTGHPSLPATTAVIILKGFGIELSHEQVQAIYASYGRTRRLKLVAKRIDFQDLNRRVAGLVWLLDQPIGSDAVNKVQQRFLAMRAYLTSSAKSKSRAIESNGLKRGVFYHFLSSFQRYGVLGLIDKGAGIFRESKIGLGNEAKLVIDKIQHPDRSEFYYQEQLGYKGIRIDRSLLSRIFLNWQVSQYQSQFVSNLSRLEADPVELPQPEWPTPDQAVPRYVDTAFITFLEGLGHSGMYIDGPGLLTVWTYLEELGLLPVLERLGLANSESGYSWLDHLLLNVGRVFYGIDSYSKACQHEEPTLSLFCHLMTTPGKDSFLNGLRSISGEAVFELQRWLVKRMRELGLATGQRLAMDFHQIDLQVIFDRLRQFGKGPSPKKKVCYNGFRPHVAWDIETGNLLVLEFRKGSARGTTTVKQFVRDFLLEEFKGLFEEVYIDSEYTGRHVWDFILDADDGMGADVVMCVKQNPWVKKHRDRFLAAHQYQDGFWVYYDDEHVYSSKTFSLTWEYEHPKTKTKKSFTIKCVVKKNIKNGKLRCFGSSRTDRSARDILQAYGLRWTIENGIKDLIGSYFLDNCPGTDPHLVNVHFFTVMLCRQLFRMMQRDAGEWMENHDNTIKTLHTMRGEMFKQGSAQIKRDGQTLTVSFMNSFSPKMTQNLNAHFRKIEKKTQDGIKLLGNLNIKWNLKPTTGEEKSNARIKSQLLATNFSENTPVL